METKDAGNPNIKQVWYRKPFPDQTCFFIEKGNISPTRKVGFHGCVLISSAPAAEAAEGEAPLTALLTLLVALRLLGLLICQRGLDLFANGYGDL